MAECDWLTPKNEVPIKVVKTVSCVVRGFTCIFVGSNPTFPTKKDLFIWKNLLIFVKTKNSSLKLPCGGIGRHDGRGSIRLH